MTTNKELLSKADIALADLTSNGGLLNPEQSNSFIRKLIEEPTLLRQIRVAELTASDMKINKIGFGSRILRVGTEATALSSGDRSKPTTEQVSLSCNEVIAEVWLPYDVIENAVEYADTANNEGSNDGPGGVRETIISLIAERAATDLEELGIQGDTTSADTYLALTDGFLKEVKTNGNTVNASGATVTKKLFKDGMKALPSKYHRNLPTMRHYVSVNQEIEYRDTLSDRATSLGDANIQGRNPAFAYGVPVEGVALIPEARGLTTNPLNLIMGVQRKVSLEYDKDISARVYKIVLTAKVDFQVEESEAAVQYENIGS